MLKLIQNLFDLTAVLMAKAKADTGYGVNFIKTAFVLTSRQEV
jgi:hypothetical protein